MGQQVTAQGQTFDSDDMIGYGYKNSTVGFFAMLVAVMAELAAADLVQSVSPLAAGNVLTAVDEGGTLVWKSGQGTDAWALEVLV